MNTWKKAGAVILAAAMTLPAFACSSDRNSSTNPDGQNSSAVDNNSSSADIPADLPGLDPGILWVNDDVDTENGRIDDGQVAATTIIQGEDGNYYVPKTDINKETVTQPDGKPETEVYTGLAKYADKDYTANYKSYQCFWLDTSQKKDFVFNGEFLVFDVKIPEDAKDGIYPVQFYYNDIANYDAETIGGVTMNTGYVCVNNDAPAAPTSNGSGLTLTPGIVAGKPGDTVKLPVEISNNPGFVAFDLRLRYDSNAVKITKCSAGSAFAAGASIESHEMKN